MTDDEKRFFLMLHDWEKLICTPVGSEYWWLPSEDITSARLLDDAYIFENQGLKSS